MKVNVCNVSNATYGNGCSLDYHYDDYGRITSVTTEENNNTVTLASYKYNKKNQVTKFTDGKSGETTEYCYDCNGNTLYKYLISEDGELLRVVEGDTEKTTVNGSMRTITSGTDDSGKSYVQNGNAKITSDTDDFGRTTKINTKLGNNPKFSVNYTYQNVVDENNQTTNRTTNKVDEMTYKLGEGENAAQIVKYKYTYDKNGNIKTIKENGISKYVYTYDSLNQLIHVADAAQYYQFEFTYDNAGNITEKRSIKSNPGGGNEGTTTVDYEYNDSTWGDLLTKYNNTNITYDNIGNPTSYRDGMTMSWSGRELQSISKNSNTYSFTYNLDGLRTKKQKNNDSIVNYYYDDSNNLIGLKKGETTVLFYYDSEGSLYSMSKGDDTYFFIKDLQGDIRKIIDEEGTVVATYAYDAWGALLAENEDSSIEGLNPFRYRGYVYDPEIELYYLQSRYYDPKTGRFINADNSAYTDTYSGSPLSTNMFAYCENNAVNLVDYGGEDAALLFKSDKPYGIGHAAILVEYQGIWYYFSVASSVTNFWGFGDMIIDYAVLGKKINEKKANTKKDLKKITIKDINTAINKSKMVKYGSGYTNRYFFKGNFEASFWYFWGIKCNPPKYNPLFNNCLHVASKSLSKGICLGKYSKYYQKALKLLTNEFIPNYAKKALQYFWGSFKTYYGMSKNKRKKLKLISPYYYFGKAFMFEQFL